MDFLANALKALPAVASSIPALIGYIFVILAWVLISWRVQRNRVLLKNLEKLPAKDRLNALRSEMGAIDVPADLTAEQWLRARNQTYIFQGFLVVVFAVVILVVASGFRPAPENHTKQLINEYDFRLNEIETRVAEIRQATNDDDKGALQVYIWRAVRGNSDFQPSLPEFANTHMVGVIVRLTEAGFTEHAKEAIQAARDLENGGAEAHSRQSPHGYGLFSQEYLDSRVKDLRSYSDYIHRKEG
jgi:hypothetical protein